ncbi:MAG: hypothetical protein ACKO8W_16655 [Dolichospermum sp.]
MRYTLCGQDARTTRVLSLISVLHNTSNCCKYQMILITPLSPGR